MNEIIFVVGLPGSGKTTLIKNRFSDTSQYQLFDDYKSNSINNNLDFTFSPKYPDLINEIKLAKKNLVISDIDFCDFRRYSEAKEIIVWWINHFNSPFRIKTVIFENALEKCQNNIKNHSGRNEKNRLKMLFFYSPRYDTHKYCYTDAIIEVVAKHFINYI